MSDFDFEHSSKPINDGGMMRAICYCIIEGKVGISSYFPPLSIFDLNIKTWDCFLSGRQGIADHDNSA